MLSIVLTHIKSLPIYLDMKKVIQVKKKCSNIITFEKIFDYVAIIF